MLTALASYDLGAGFEIGARMRYATGFPRTPVNDAYYDVETCSASWFVTAGSFEDSRTGLGVTDKGALAENRWIVPADAGEVTLWVVLRDNRGGVSWKSARLAVE